MTVLGLLLMALGSSAHAETCDARTLETALKEASPVQVPLAFERLANCDPNRAKRHVTAVMERTLSGEEADRGAIAAMRLGASDTVRDWLGGLEPDQFSSTINRLGARCKDDDAVEAFLVGSAEKLGKAFFTDRWHRGLADCRKESIRAILADALANDPTESRGQYFALVEVYARNFGALAVPTLVEKIKATSDGEVQTYLVEAFADAANVGSVEGRDDEAAATAAEALLKLGSSLDPKAVDTSRRVLTALGMPDKSDAFVQYRWPDRLADGHYSYGVAALVTGTCKNGKQKGDLHLGIALEPAMHWPDQLKSSVEQFVQTWSAQEDIVKCKGTPSIAITTMTEPAVNADAISAWMTEQKTAFEASAGSYHKPQVVPHEAAPL